MIGCRFDLNSKRLVANLSINVFFQAELMFLWIWPWTLVWSPEGTGPVWVFTGLRGQTGQALHLTHRRGVGVCVVGGWGTLFNHIFYLFSSLIAMTVAAPCTPTTLARRLTGLKADTPITLWWGSGGGQLQPNLVLIWGHRSASVQVIYTSEPSPPSERVVRGRKLVSATFKCAFFKFHTRKEWKKKR